jgi:hypothetical protein
MELVPASITMEIRFISVARNIVTPVWYSGQRQMGVMIAEDAPV